MWLTSWTWHVTAVGSAIMSFTSRSRGCTLAAKHTALAHSGCASYYLPLHFFRAFSLAWKWLAGSRVSGVIIGVVAAIHLEGAAALSASLQQPQQIEVSSAMHGPATQSRVFDALCSCPPSWEQWRLHFNTAMELDGNSQEFADHMYHMCDTLVGDLLKVSDRFFEVVLASPLEEAAQLARSLQESGKCLAGLAAASYACIMSTWMANEVPSFKRLLNIAAPLFVHTLPCFEPHVNSWRITPGQAFRQMEKMAYYPDTVSMNDLRDPIPFCTQDFRDKSPTLLGHCSDTMPHRIMHAIAGPQELISNDDVVLCTHTSITSLALVEHMLTFWRGPVSVAVFAYDVPLIDVMPKIRSWVQHLAELGLQQVVVSFVGPNGAVSTAFDRLYPANLLRQVAVDAVSADLVLIADPGFAPSRNFRAFVNSSSPSGEAIRALFAAAPTALLVTSFLVYEDVPTDFDIPQLRNFLDSGMGVSFDATVCALCHSYAWQTMLLLEPGALRFPKVSIRDLYHPAWLLPRSVLPRFPPFMHSLVSPISGHIKLGWLGMPCGLKFSADQMIANGVQIMLLPNAFLHRRESHRMPNEVDARWEKFPSGFGHTMHYLRLLASLPNANKDTPVVSRVIMTSKHYVEIGHWQPPTLFTLQQGTDSSLQVIVRASTVLGSEGLERLISSVPWAVHAVAVGAADYQSKSWRDLPIALRSFRKDQLIMIVDAYDVMMLPCSRSVVEEFHAFHKELVFAADTSCFPNLDLCKPCEQRYDRDSPDFEACKAFPYVNGGGYMGTAASLASAFEWMNENADGDSPHHIAGKDLESIYHFYNRFPEKVALDHRQRIWSCLFGGALDHYHITDCRVASDYAGHDVCIVHANGQTRTTILAPLLKQLMAEGCIGNQTQRKAEPYVGIISPESFVQ